MIVGEIPPQFWATLAPGDFSAICDRGGLNAIECKRVFAILGRTDKPPKFMEVLVDKAQLDRWLNEKFPKKQ